MKIKILLVAFLIITLMVSGCMRSEDVHCNYDGVCEDWETDDCPDCADVLGRGVQESVVASSDEEEFFE